MTTFWERITDTDRAKIDTILNDLAAVGKLTHDNLANFSELIARTGLQRYTAQRHLRNLPRHEREPLRGRDLASRAEARQIGITSSSWKYNRLYHARELLAAVAWATAKHQQTIAEGRPDRDSMPDLFRRKLATH